MQRSLCHICKLIYVPTEVNCVEHWSNDLVCSTSKTTAVEPLPDDWICSVCYTTREDFQQLTETLDVSLESRLCPFQF